MFLFITKYFIKTNLHKVTLNSLKVVVISPFKYSSRHGRSYLLIFFDTVPFPFYKDNGGVGRDVSCSGHVVKLDCRRVDDLIRSVFILVNEKKDVKDFLLRCLYHLVSRY